MHRKAVIIATIVAALGIAAYFSNRSEDSPREENLSKINESKPSNLRSDQPKRIVNQRTCRASIPPVFPAGIAFTHVKPDFERQLLSNAYSDVSATLGKVDSNDDAKIAIFLLAANCFPHLIREGLKVRQLYGCPDPSSVKLEQHPLTLLKLAAESGSLEAKLLFLQNAPNIANYYKQLATPEAMAFAAGYIALAEKFGIEAAKAGNIDASLAMSRAYEHGFFGVRDPIKAYLYSQPILIAGNEIEKQSVKYLSTRITAEQRSDADSNAFGCGGSYDPNVLALPFERR